jgi:adenylate cyclase
VALAVCVQVQSSQFGSALENRSYDFRFKLRGPLPLPPEAPIVILALDEESLSRIADPLILWQKHYAKVLEELIDARAGVVGLDLIFADIQHLDLVGQQRLFQSLFRARQVGVPVILAHRVHGSEPPPPMLTIAAGEENFAYVNLTTDDDDFVRRQEVYSKERRPGFALAVARAFRPGAGTRFTAPSERLLINYLGFDVFPRIPFWQALEAAEAGRKDFFEKLRGRIILLGTIGDDDLHSTPLYYLRERSEAHPFRRTPGIEIHANTVATLLKENFIRPVPSRTQFLVTLLLLSLVTLLCIFLPPWIGLSASGVLIAAYLLAADPLFSRGWSVLVVGPVSGAICAVGLSQTANFILEGREKRRLRQHFKSYVNDEVIEKLLRHADTLALRGEKKRVTVLFSDIRNFTTRSEKTAPELLVQDLNRYLTLMVEIIQKHKGSVDKFLGDGIMAVFGAPLDDADAELHSVESAIEMLTALETLNQEFQQRGDELIRIGIGIHTGEAIVGNIGSPKKMEYTAIGDVVNTASRIEGLNKKYSSESGILISAETFEALQGRIPAEYAGDEIVKGKSVAVAIYRVLPGERLRMATSA